jgi:hypothetical protein
LKTGRVPLPIKLVFKISRQRFSSSTSAFSPSTVGRSHPNRPDEQGIAQSPTATIFISRHSLKKPATVAIWHISLLLLPLCPCPFLGLPAPNDTCIDWRVPKCADITQISPVNTDAVVVLFVMTAQYTIISGHENEANPFSRMLLASMCRPLFEESAGLRPSDIVIVSALEGCSSLLMPHLDLPPAEIFGVMTSEQ